VNKISYRVHDRRKAADLTVRLMRIFGVFGWLAMFAALVILAKAKPEHSLIDEDFLARFGYHASIRRAWDMDLARYIYYLMLMGLGLSVAGLWLHRRRARRKDDGYGLYLLLLGSISLAGIVIYQLLLA